MAAAGLDPSRFGVVRRGVNDAGVHVGGHDPRDLASWLEGIFGGDGDNSGSHGQGAAGAGIGNGAGGGVARASDDTSADDNSTDPPVGGGGHHSTTDDNDSHSAPTSPSTHTSPSRTTSSHTSSSHTSGSSSSPVATVVVGTVTPPPTGAPSESSGSGISTGAIVGIVAALGVVAGVAFWAYRRWSRNRQDEADHHAALGGFGVGGGHQELHSNDGASSFHEKGSGWGSREKEDNWNGGGQGVGANLNRTSSWGNEGTLMGGAAGLRRQDTLPLGAEAGNPFGHPQPPPPSAFGPGPGYGGPGMPGHPYGMGGPGMPPQAHMGGPPMGMRNMAPPGSPGFYPPPPVSPGFGYPGTPHSANPLLGPPGPGTPPIGGVPYNPPNQGPNPLNANFRQLTSSPGPMAMGGMAAAQAAELHRMPSNGTMRSGSNGPNPFSPQGSTFGGSHSQGGHGEPPMSPGAASSAAGSHASNPFGDHPDGGKVFNVVRTFEPNPDMDDELMIYPNDKVLILATYDDGWSAGVNLCHPEPRRQGVFPRDCVDLAPKSEQLPASAAAAIAISVGHNANADPHAQPGQPFQSIPEEDEHPLSPKHQVPQLRQPTVSAVAPSLPPLNLAQGGPCSPGKSAANLKRSSSLMASRDQELFSALGDVGHGRAPPHKF